jgi:hypothetical protein
MLIDRPISVVMSLLIHSPTFRTVDILRLPVVLTTILCDLFGSDEPNSFFICPALNDHNVCFLAEFL